VTSVRCFPLERGSRLKVTFVHFAVLLRRLPVDSMNLYPY
jgi:hypothetical protein